MLIVRQSTARTVTVGPVLDADGVAVTGGVVGDFKIAKNGGAPAALNGSATLTHRHTGFYSLALTATDLDTVGQAEVVIDDTVNACPMKEITVVEEVIYDALFVASANAFTGAAGASKVSGVVLTDTVTTYTGNTPQTGDAYAVVNSGTHGNAALKTLIDTVDTVADTILVDTNELQTDWVNGGRLDNILDARASQTSVDDLPTNAELATALGTADDAVLAQIALVKASTDNLPSDPADASVVAGLIAAVEAKVDTVDTVVDAIKLKTDNLPSDPADASVVAGLIAAVETDTQDIQARLPAALGANGNIKADLIDVGGTAVPAGYTRAVTKSIAYGTCDAGGSTTSIPTSAFSPAAAAVDQFKGRIVIFANDTTTAELRGQASDITASTDDATPTLTVTALTTAPASGDVFVVQ
jgi:hypothetical protein